MRSTLGLAFWLGCAAAAGCGGHALALDCLRLEQPRINYRLAGTMAVDGRKIPLSIEISRADITIVRLRSDDGAIDILSETREFAPSMAINGRTGETTRFKLRPVSGSINGFEEGSLAVYEQTTMQKDAAPKVERVSQKIGSASTVRISGCDIPVIRIERSFEDLASKARRDSMFDYSPALTYPVMSRSTLMTPTGPRDQVVETVSIEIEDKASEK